MIFNAANWYWLDDKGALYGSKQNKLLDTKGPDYVAWMQMGGIATVWPRNEAGKQDKASLNVMLDWFALPHLA